LRTNRNPHYDRVHDSGWLQQRHAWPGLNSVLIVQQLLPARQDQIQQYRHGLRNAVQPYISAIGGVLLSYLENSGGKEMFWVG